MKHGIATEGAAPLLMDNEVANDLPGLTIDCTIIEGDRWGSSGFYPGDVLKRDGSKVFTEGTHSYLDHAEPGKESAGNLMGVLMEDARYVEENENGKPALKAPIRFFETGTYNAAWVKDRMPALGLSIRAGVDFEQGTRQGRSGRIVTAFTEAISVDVVHRAGAGGKFGTIKESANPGATTEQGGADVPLTEEEKKDIAAAAAAGVAEALAKPLADIVTAVQESAKPRHKEFTTSELFEEVEKAKLTPSGRKAVLAVHEAKGNVEEAIATEKQREKEVREAAGLPEGRADFNEDGTVKTEVTESKAPQGWAVATEGK